MSPTVDAEAPRKSLLRFGVFELDLKNEELRKSGSPIKLQPQPFKVLTLLTERPGELVSREEIRQQIWGGETFVDFERGLNFCISQIRAALGDDANTPRYIETLPRRGYRFIGPVSETIALRGETPSVPVPAQPTPRPHRTGRLMLLGGALPALALLGFVLNVGGWRQRLVGPPVALRIQSLAVLPLENLTGDPAQEYFADGMTDALITNLAKLSAVRVISRTSVMAYKGVRKPLPQVARELNVDALVEGTVARSDERVRIDVQLVQAANDQHVWAENYERDLKDVLSLQDEVARDIARQIQAKLLPPRSDSVSRSRVNPEAYQFYVQGRYFWNRRSEEGFIKAIECFEQAIAKQPDYAQAYAGLSDVYALLGTWPNARIPRSETMARARAAALKALEIDDTMAEAHASLASVSLLYDWNWPLAEKEFQRAIQLNPNYATAHHWYAYYCASQGRMDEAVREIHLARQLDPLSLIISTDAGEIFYHARRYVEAIEQFRKTLEMDPNFAPAHNWLGLTYLARQEYGESITELQTAVRLSDNRSDFLASLGIAYARAGRREEARKALKAIRTGPSARYDSLLAIAWILAALGERDQAFAWAEKTYPTRSPEFYILKVHPIVDPLRSDARFQYLMRRVGFPT